jgi:hypothetical protein
MDLILTEGCWIKLRIKLIKVIDYPIILQQSGLIEADYH